jgi:hypothetical protein
LNTPLSGLTDALLLWLYLSLLALILLTALYLVVCALARPLPGELLVALPLLAYLALLWWYHGATASVLTQSGFLLAMLVTIWACAALAGRLSSTPHSRLLVVTLVTAGILLIVARTLLPAQQRGEPPPPFGTHDGAPRMLFIGVDGMDSGIVDRYASRGRVSELLDSMLGGAVFPFYRAKGPDPAELWSTILTGLPPTQHGVLSVEDEPWPGVATPLPRRVAAPPLRAVASLLLPTRTRRGPGTSRHARDLSEILALRKPAASIGWRGSWPARPFDADDAEGKIVSDRAIPRLLSGMQPDRDAWPDWLFPQLAGRFETERAQLRREFDALVTLPEGSEIRRWLWQSFLIDAYSWRLATLFGSDPSVGGVFVYLPGLGILRQRLEGAGGDRQRHTLLETDEALETYVGWLDRLLGGALQATPGWDVLLVADPGLQATREVEGFVVVAGPDARPGCVASSHISALDVAPLGLELIGFPSCAEMTGKSPAVCLVPRADSPQPVSTYGRASASLRAAPSSSLPEMIERLSWLGYIE